MVFSVAKITAPVTHKCTSTEQFGGGWGWGTPKYSETNLSQSQFVHHKSYVDWTGIELDPSASKAGDWPPEPWHGLTVYWHNHTEFRIPCVCQTISFHCSGGRAICIVITVTWIVKFNQFDAFYAMPHLSINHINYTICTNLTKCSLPAADKCCLSLELRCTLLMSLTHSRDSCTLSFVSLRHLLWDTPTMTSRSRRFEQLLINSKTT